MRKITEQAVNAFKSGKNFKSGNTEVVATGNVVMMYLHGNQIAKRILVDFNKNKWETLISNAGWITNTTKERLNGLEAGIYQKNFFWYWKDGKDFPNNTFVKI